MDIKNNVMAEPAGWMDHAAAPILCYCASSILMTVLNKFVLSPTWNLNFALIMFQGIVCLLFLVICKHNKIIKFRDYNSKDAKAWYHISIFLVAMIYSGSKAIQYLPIPIYTIFKNLTIIVIAMGEVAVFNAKISSQEAFAFFLIVLSSIVAASDDISKFLFGSNPTAVIPDTSVEAASGLILYGYLWMAGNCLCSAVYVIGMRKRIKSIGFSDFDTMFYNNLLSTPVLLILTLLTEDWSSENVQRNFPPESRSGIMFAIVLTGLGTACISYTTAWCVRVTTGATYSMVGALNKIPVAMSGYVFFGNKVTFSGLLAIAIGTASGIVYGIAKQKK